MAAVAVPPGVIERIVEVLTPEEVWLFGSRARQTHGPDSDWDLMVILPDEAPDHDLDLATVWGKLPRVAADARGSDPDAAAGF